MVTPPIIDGEYRMTARTVRGPRVSCASSHAMKKERMNPPGPTITANLKVLGRTFCKKIGSFVIKEM